MICGIERKIRHWIDAYRMRSMVRRASDAVVNESEREVAAARRVVSGTLWNQDDLERFETQLHQTVLKTTHGLLQINVVVTHKALLLALVEQQVASIPQEEIQERIAAPLAEIDEMVVNVAQRIFERGKWPSQRWVVQNLYLAMERICDGITATDVDELPGGEVDVVKTYQDAVDILRGHFRSKYLERDLESTQKLFSTTYKN